MTLHIRYEPMVAEGNEYSLTCRNESPRNWVFYVYQKLPQQKPDMFSLAWFASPYLIRPGDFIKFSWFIEYNFVWGNTGTLQEGVTFVAGGVKAADPQTKNITEFSMEGGAPGLSNPEKGGSPGTLYIEDQDTTPDKLFSVGIGMSGTGTFVEQAGPNLSHLFTPTPQYWVAAGAQRSVGEVLDIKTITRTAEVKYPINNYAQIATLNEDYTWSFS